jgi:hypothetical protein
MTMSEREIERTTKVIREHKYKMAREALERKQYEALLRAAEQEIAERRMIKQTVAMAERYLQESKPQPQRRLSITDFMGGSSR